MKVTDASSGSGKWYYYEKNLQGDIVGIMNADGYKVVSYSYDAWGVPYAPVYSTDSVVSAADKANAALNPFRYRGYYYDSETGYYYLQTRYYNPEWGRFINADGYINANGDILGYNMFAYCSNNPVNCVDPNGNMLIPIIIGVVAVGSLLFSLSSCSSKDIANAGAQIIEEAELGPPEAQDIAHGHNSANQAYGYADTFKSLIEFADSLDNSQAAMFEYSCAVIAYRKNGKITYSQNMIDNFGSYNIFEQCITRDAIRMDAFQIAFSWTDAQVNDPKHLSDNFSIWAASGKGYIAKGRAKYSLQKGYDFYKNYFDIISGSVG